MPGHRPDRGDERRRTPRLDRSGSRGRGPAPVERHTAGAPGPRGRAGRQWSRRHRRGRRVAPSHGAGSLGVGPLHGRRRRHGEMPASKQIWEPAKAPGPDAPRTGRRAAPDGSGPIADAAGRVRRQPRGLASASGPACLGPEAGWLPSDLSRGEPGESGSRASWPHRPRQEPREDGPTARAPSPDRGESPWTHARRRDLASRRIGRRSALVQPVRQVGIDHFAPDHRRGDGA